MTKAPRDAEPAAEQWGETQRAICEAMELRRAGKAEECIEALLVELLRVVGENMELTMLIGLMGNGYASGGSVRREVIASRDAINHGKAAAVSHTAHGRVAADRHVARSTSLGADVARAAVELHARARRGLAARRAGAITSDLADAGTGRGVRLSHGRRVSRAPVADRRLTASPVIGAIVIRPASDKGESCKEDMNMFCHAAQPNHGTSMGNTERLFHEGKRLLTHRIHPRPRTDIRE